MPPPVFAVADMRENLITAGAVLLLGILALRVLRPRTAEGARASARWIPLLTLIAGPVLAAGFWSLDVFVLWADDYISMSERLEEAPAILGIGAFAGVVVAAIFSVSLGRSAACAEDDPADARGWSQAYWAVAILALILMPAGAYVAAMTTASAAHVTIEFDAELPAATERCINVGQKGYALIAGAGLAVIGSLAFRRNEPLAVVVSAAIFAGCLGFFLFAALASHYPFWSITYGLT